MLTALLMSCKTVEPLYYHGNYNSAVYSYFKAEEISLEEQISMMQEIIRGAESNAKAIAPGVHAHLGMLYFEAGNASEGITHFEIEKKLYPESTHYIDFLMTAARGGNNEAE